MDIEVFEERGHGHVEALTQQLRSATVDYAAQLQLTGKQLAELLQERGVIAFGGAAYSFPHNRGLEHLRDASFEVTEEACDYILEHADELEMGDCLVILEALGAEVDVTVLLPVQAQKKLMPVRKQHRLQVADHLNDLPRRLQRRKKQ